MATPEQLQALKNVFGQAQVSEHIFPAMAACEAMVETGWLTSELGRDYCNLFGVKQSVDVPIYLTVNLPTKEYLLGQWVTMRAKFVWFPTFAESFTERMRTLERLQDQYPAYKEALHAPDAESYVTAVSRTWSTDPTRAVKCISIYRSHQDILNPTPLETV